MPRRETDLAPAHASPAVRKDVEAQPPIPLAPVGPRWHVVRMWISTLLLNAPMAAPTAADAPPVAVGAAVATAQLEAGTSSLGPLLVDTAHFTPWMSLAGGLMIGVSSLMVLWLFGQTAGISGITAAVVRGEGAKSGGWKLGLLVGLVGSGAVAAFAAPELITSSTSSWALLAVAGVCVGLGTRTGGGCTSGHGVCGLGRARPRSAIAVPVFMAFGALTVFALRVLGGGA